MERTEENLDQAVEMLMEAWECLKGNPLTPSGWKGLAKTLLDLASDWDMAKRLVEKVRDGADWRPSPIEMRRVYCQFWKPADGREDNDFSLNEVMRGKRA